MRDEPIKAAQKVSCLCGGTVRVDPLKQDRRVTCPSCNSTFDFVVTVDSARKKSMISLVLPKTAMKTGGESLAMLGGHDAAPPAPTKEPARPAPRIEPPKAVPKGPGTRVTRSGRRSGRTIAGVPMATCECGAVFAVEDNGELTSVQSCPECERSYHVVFKIEPTTKKKAAIIVPAKQAIHGRMDTTAPAKPSARPGEVTDFFTKKGRTRVSKPPAKPKPPAEVPPGAQGVACSCGQVFIVRRRDIGQEKTCEGCGKTSTFEEGRDPQTLAPIIRIRQ